MEWCPAYAIFRVCFEVGTMTQYYSADNVIEKCMKGATAVDTRVVDIGALID